MPATRLPLPLAVVLLLIAPAITAAAGNFTCADPAIRRAAEAARIRSARFWTGRELPGRWARPCPITVESDRSTGGVTRFTFSGGEVFGWSMLVRGTRQAILDDVIPHEVDHAVRASLVRRPIVRWLDEGCASLMESPAVHARLRQQALTADGRRLLRAWLDRSDYPRDGRDLAALYATGFSFVEYLLECGGPQRLLELQRDPRRPSVKFHDHYRADADRLIDEWHARLPARLRLGTACDCCGCPVHGPGAFSLDDRPVLTVWTSQTCGPCRQFRYDLDHDANFREAIASRFRLETIDVDRERQRARSAGIRAVPTFQVGNLRVKGYEGPAWLLQQLTQSADLPESPDRDAVPPTDDAPSSDVTGADITDDVPADPPASDDIPHEEPAEPPAPVRSSPSPPSPAPRVPPVTAADAGRFLLSLAELALLIGGSVATGGVGTAVAAGAARLLLRSLSRRREQKRQRDVPPDRKEDALPRAPFPRELDEARELLAIRQSEGRVAVLDALRGMFFDDECDRLIEQGEDCEVRTVRQLRERIDARVDEVAPLSVRSE
ncbi:thioredoxin family protein [Maioricimonas sp. JC845]|uniref:thioredoxin family protein n=1 Tax=Maioricimonas sp. JC845 TaxID=3232138 RepID=UPI0034595D88